MRIDVLNGANLDILGRRDPALYGGMSLPELETRIYAWASELGTTVRCRQTNHEGEYVEELHKAGDYADGLLLNPGAWTHYAWAIRDAVEISGLPAVEVHLSDVKNREPFRRVSVLEDVCVASVSGKGVEGYREALEALRSRLGVPV